MPSAWRQIVFYHADSPNLISKGDMRPVKHKRSGEGRSH